MTVFITYFTAIIIMIMIIMIFYVWTDTSRQS